MKLFKIILIAFTMTLFIGLSAAQQPGDAGLVQSLFSLLGLGNKAVAPSASAVVAAVPAGGTRASVSGNGASASSGGGTAADAACC